MQLRLPITPHYKEVTREGGVRISGCKRDDDDGVFGSRVLLSTRLGHV